MAGLTSDNISIASARQYGFSKERNTCVFCGKKTTPPPSDPLAPVFAFFSLVDCRHYVCQPCALVNCDNAGRYIRCPTCHAVSRLAQSGKKRTGRDESRVAIDDGVSSVGSHASRRSMLIAANNRQLRSALARADRNKKRSNSVQFIATPKPTTASAAAENKSGNDDAAETTSPLTLDAVERLPKDPIFAQRELNRDSVTEHSGTEEPVRVNLYNIKSSSVPRRRPSGNRASSVPLPPTEHRYLVPPLPFAPPPPLRIHTIEEDENKDKKEGEEKVEEEKTNNNNNNSIKHNGDDDEIGIDVSPRTIFAEIKETLRAYVVKEAQERTAIGLAEEHRRNAVIKQREIREKELLAVRGNLSSEFDIGLSPRTPLDASDEQVSATSDDDTPPNRPTANHYDAGSDDVLRHHEEEPPSAKVSISETATTSQEATTTTTTTNNATTTAGTKFESPKDNENSVPYEIMEAKEEENANVELEVQERGREHHETEETPLQQEQQEQQHGLEVMRIMERMVSELVENEIEEREMVEDLEDMERRRTHSMSEKNKMEISALEVQRLSAERTAQMVAEYQEYILKEIEELTSTENERRLFIEKLQRSEWSSVYSDFYTTLERIFEDEFIREEEQRKLELRRALSMLSSEESTARVQIEQTLLDDMTRLHMKCLETLADYRRQLEVDEMQLGLARLLEERRFNVQQLHDLMVEENMTRWELIEGQRQDYHATWTSFITTMPAIRTTTAPPSSVASPTTFSIAHSSHVPETFAPVSTSLTLASQYISAVLEEEEELGSLHIQQTERHERHDLMKNFLAKCRRLKDAEAYAEDLYMETPISKRSIANGLRRLELQEEEMRIELQQRSWMLFRSILNKEVEEHQQIDEMERMLRSIAKRSRSVVKRCWGEVELALFEEETHERQKIEVGERRVYMNLSREATRRMEVLLAEERFSYDVSGVQFLEAMDAAVREFSSEAMRISQEEHLERLTMLQKERLDRLSVQQGVDESLLQRSNNDTRKQLEALRSTLEATTANNAWRARLSLVVTEEIRARDVVYNDEAGERSEWMGKERRERMEMASLETERILQEKEASRLREKMRECEEVEEQRRAGVQREETRAWNAFVKDEMQHASYAEKKTKERFRRTLDSCLQQEEDDRQDISDAERDAYRYLRRHAIQLSFDNAEKMRTSTAKTGDTSDKTGAVVVALPQSRGPSALSDLSAPIIDEEWIQQRRLKELTREEELLETQMRLREAKLRIVEEEERCSRLEEEKRRTQAEADRLLFEAERRAEEHIRKAREEAEWYVENEVSRVRNVTEREAAHAAALRAIEEEEKRAVIEAKLLAAERALKEAEKRAEENMQSTKAEAETFAVAEARRVAIESKRQLQEYREEQELEMRRKDLEVKQRLHNIEQETREAISQEREKATRAAEEAKRRLEELEARYVERLAAVDAAKAGVREAQQQKQEFEGSLQATPQSHSRQQQQQQTEEQKEKHAVQDVETVATTNTTTAAVAAVLRGSREEAGNDDGCALPTSVWGSLIRSAIREAVEEIVRAKKEAWHLSEELEHRRRMERQHMRVRQVERDRAEQDLIDVGSKSLMWSETGEDSRNLISTEENEVIEQHQQEQEQQQQVRNARKLPPPRRTMRHDHHHHHYHCVDEREVVGKYRLQRSSTNHGSCIYCGKNTVSPCGTCESQVCIYCGPGVRRSPCCNMHHINIINDHRRQLSREPHREEEEDEEERRQQQEKDEYYEDVVGVERNIQDDSSIWDVEDSMAVTRPPEMEDSPSPPAVHHQLLPDEDSKVRNDSDGDDDDNNDEEPQRHERERQAMKEEERNKEEAARSKSRSEDHLNGSERSASNATVEEPMTEKKRYGVFFVPLTSNAEPRRPKPPTPRNYVPGVFTATSKFAKVERRRTPSIRRAHTNKNYNHNTANRHVHPADKTVRHSSRSRFTESAPKRRPATSAHPKLHRDHVPRQSYDMPSSMRLREPAHGRYDSRPRRMDAERRVMHDPLSAFGTTLNPNYLGANVSAKTRSSPRRMMGRISPFRPSIEMDDDFNDGNDHYQDRDVSGLQRTYYNGKPLRPLERDYYHPDDMGNISSRPSRRHRHQEQYKPKANRSQQEEEQEKGHLNVTHEHVYVTTYQEMPHYEETQRRPESVVHNTRRLEECNLHTTPRLEELDQRLQRLKQHRLFDRVDRRSPDFHCLRHHYEQERESSYIHHHNSSNNNLAPASGRLRRPTPCSHDPCVTVRLFPNTHIPTQTNNTSRQKIRGDSSQRHMSRSGRRSTPRVISPPWRTDFNSEPLRPPWNVEQPHSFIAKPYKRSLLFVDP